jgi:polyvinyl alcohol dehydrogenase (cytochrome)
VKNRRWVHLIGSAATIGVAVVALTAGTGFGYSRGESSQAAQSPELGATVYKERCATCHDMPEATRSPSRENLKARTVQQILASLEPGGTMAAQGQPLSTAEKQAVAAFLSGAAPAPAPATSGAAAVSIPSLTTAATPAIDPSVGACAPSMISAAMPNPSSHPMWNGWGNDHANTRFQQAKAAGLTAADVPKLTLKWAFAYAGANVASGQPTMAAGRVFVGNQNGLVYSLDAKTGCTYWTFKAEAGVRTAITVAPAGSGHVAMFGDIRANVYAIDAQTGKQLWKIKVDDHAFARITGAPSYANGRLYVPVSSVEEVAGARPNYPCCTFRGSVVALDVATGKQIWKSYMIPEAPKEVGKNSAGTPQFRSAGAAIWTSPTIDVAKNMIYVATGNAYTSPAAPSSDAVVALNMSDGAIQWTQQATPGDVFVIGCKPGVENCPSEVGPDHDFGNSPILRTLPGGRRILTLGQKSGVVYGIDPDNKGKILWQLRVAKGGELGGIEWGSAADEQNIYVPVSDVLRPPAEAGGLVAIRLTTGEQVWHAPPAPLKCEKGPACTGAQSAPVSVIPGVVFSGSVDGHLRAYSTADGKVLWDFDTIREYQTVNGVKGQGGSIDAAGPVIAGGMLLTNSGYGQWRGKAGNVLLAFGLP